MEIQTEFKFRRSYLPTPRCRKWRQREEKSATAVTVPEVTAAEAPVAFRVTEYDMHTGGPATTPYLLWHGRLWRPRMWYEEVCGTEGALPPEELHQIISRSYRTFQSEEEAIKSENAVASDYLIVDGVVYFITDEPRYVVMTFGLGHNHGGTAIFVETGYNSNISHERYFTALERGKALAAARRIASNRGDTEDLPHLGDHKNIEVLLPEAVKCNPAKDHGDGDPFMNGLEALTETADSAAEAGILVLTKTLSELK